jgi:ABC-type transport system involved in cytochrome c biogenesis permease subunit
MPLRRPNAEQNQAAGSRSLTARYADFSPTVLHKEHNVRLTPKRAFWEAFATVCLPSLVLWTFFAYFLRWKLNFPYAEAMPICLFLALLPMPLAFPVYRRYLKGTPRRTKTLSPRINITLAILFAVVGIMRAAELPELLHSRKNVSDVVFHVAIATVWLAMSVEYVRRATKKQPPTAV